MKISQSGIDLIKGFEGCSNTVYLDVVGKPTIGVGHLIQPGQIYTYLDDAACDALLRQDLLGVESAILRTRVVLNQNQYDALCSLIFNIGVGNYTTSTLRKKLGFNDYVGAANEFPRWNKAGGKEVQGLISRRAKERDLFLKF